MGADDFGDGAGLHYRGVLGAARSAMGMTLALARRKVKLAPGIRWDLVVGRDYPRWN